jgi:hypothetical protein
LFVLFGRVTAILKLLDSFLPFEIEKNQPDLNNRLQMRLSLTLPLLVAVAATASKVRIPQLQTLANIMTEYSMASISAFETVGPVRFDGEQVRATC